jgi:CheY-like chemotaxis protein
VLGASDTGVGMDAATRSRIFEPFFTTKAKDKGRGLGLATVYGIVEQAGGWIEVYSEPGQGTSFEVYVPRVFDEPAPLGRRETPAPRGGQETVLVVEDDSMVRDVAVGLLGDCGYEVLAAGSAAEALELAARRQGPIDLLLTDVVMAHVDGHELAARLSERRPGLKVLYSSGYAENVIVHHGVLDPGVQSIAKPYSLDALSACVREVLDGPKEKDGQDVVRPPQRRPRPVTR